MDSSIAAVVSAKRINVVGVTGSGKSTLARQIAEIKQLPCYEMDQLFWLPNWQEQPDDEFLAKLTEVVNREDWVLDGNYKRTTDIKWPRVECVVWIDLPFALTFRRLFGRCIHRARSQRELWPGTGNRESFRRMLCSRDSILWWLIKTYRHSHRHYSATIQDTAFAHIDFVHLESGRAVNHFVELLQQHRHST